VAPLVEEMLARIAGEVGRYERVVTYWPVFGPLLEGAVCAALREATGAVSRQCGLGLVGLPGPGRGGRARAPPPPPPPPSAPPPPPLRPPRHRADPPHTAPLEQWRWLLTHLGS